jgi:uncharacterized membrane protein YecN with MAPEG domain
MIIAFWTLPLTLIFLWLSFRVIRYRRAERIPLGSGGNAALERAIRAHANFAENVPFAVLQLILGALGLIRARTMLAAWRWVLLAAAVAGAVLTPSTDPVTMLLLGGAITALYLVGVGLVALSEQLRPAAASDAA